MAGRYACLIKNVFLPNAALMSHIVPFGELFDGVALIVGFLTEASAFFGGLMNVAFLLADTVSSNPVMFILATWVVLAWRVAGDYGLDYWVSPRIGAPQGGFGAGRGPARPRGAVFMLP